MIKSPLYWIAFAVLLTLSGVAQAQDQSSGTSTSAFPKPGPLTSREEMRPHIGLLAGTSHPEGRYDTGFGYGLEVGYQPYIPFGLAVELTKTDNEGRGSNSTVDQTVALVKGTYNFGGTNYFFRNSFAGVAIGEVFKSSHNDIASAPLVGFDLPLKPTNSIHNLLTLGVTAKYLIVNGDDPDSLIINGALKYWY